MRLIIVVLSGVLIFSSPPFAFSQVDLSSPEARLEEARSLYREARFQDAIRVLSELIDTLDALDALGEERLKLADAHFLLGLNYAAVQADAQAKENFAVAKGLDPQRALDPDVYAPRVIQLFRDAEYAGAAGVLDVESPTVGGTRLSRGTRVRASIRGDGPNIVGNVLRLDAGNLLIVDEGFNQLEVPLDRIDRLEVSTGKKSSVLWGLVLGAASGAAIGALETPDTDCVGEGCFTRGENIGYTATGMGLVGALVGAFIKTDRWVELPAGLDLQLAASARGGAALGVVLSF